MDARKFLGGRHLKKEDVPKPILVTISEVTSEEFSNDGKDARQKLVLYFKETDKGLAMNAGNTDILGRGFRTFETDEWVGRRIVVFTDPDVRFAGKRVGGLVVRMPQNLRPSATTAAPTREPDYAEEPPPSEKDDPGFDDDIPF